MRGPAEAARYHAGQELAAHRAGAAHNDGSLDVEATEHFVHPKDLIIGDELMAKVRSNHRTTLETQPSMLFCTDPVSHLQYVPHLNTDHCGRD